MGPSSKTLEAGEDRKLKVGEETRLEARLVSGDDSGEMESSLGLRSETDTGLLGTSSNCMWV